MSMLRTPVTSADHIQGLMDAPATLVEYGDYECGHCGLAFPNIKWVQKRFAKKLRFVFRHFPLTEAHPFAEAAAEAAEYAGTHDLFWEMHDGLYANQDELGLALILSLGSALGLSDLGLRDALASGDSLQRYKPISLAACAAASMEHHRSSSTARSTQAPIHTRNSPQRSMRIYRRFQRGRAASDFDRQSPLLRSEPPWSPKPTKSWK